MPVSSNDQYTAWTGLIYIFNLIVGTGALTLPAAFNKAGWLVGIIMILALAFVSFITVTFILEAIACCNAIIQQRRVAHLKRVTGVLNEALRASQSPDDDEEDQIQDEAAPLFSDSLQRSFPSQPTSFYNLDGRIELGEMATTLFPKVGSFLFYACITVYLYGDLSIYASAMSKSLGDVICTFEPNETTACGDTLNPRTSCWENWSIQRLDVYRIIIVVITIVIGPFTFFNVQKTKYLQIMTSVMRWIAFTSMISYAIYRLVTVGPQNSPKMASLTGMPALVGASVYSFMCHHSLPSLISPITDKRYLTRLLAMDYNLIAGFYLLLALTGIFAFSNLDELYTLVFSPSCRKISGVPDTLPMRILSYFLTLFPVLTLSASFPVIAVTLRNNLKYLFLRHNTSAYPWYVQHMFPFFAVIPPILIALLSEDLELLVKVTGSFPGVGIQYIFPALLVWCARRKAANALEDGVPNEFKSPFQGSVWVVFVLLWALACVALVMVNLFAT